MSAVRAIADAPDTPVVLRLAPGPGRRWQDEALCAQVDPDLWFPEKGESSRRPKQCVPVLPGAAPSAWTTRSAPASGCTGSGAACPSRSAAG